MRFSHSEDVTERPADIECQQVALYAIPVKGGANGNGLVEQVTAANLPANVNSRPSAAAAASANTLKYFMVSSLLCRNALAREPQRRSIKLCITRLVVSNCVLSNAATYRILTIAVWNRTYM